MIIRYNEESACAHIFTSGLYCVKCGEKVECQHQAHDLLELPAVVVDDIYGNTLRLRQCDYCHRIGVVRRDETIAWARSPKRGA